MLRWKRWCELVFLKHISRPRPDSTWFESFNGYFHCCNHYISFTKQFCNLVGNDGASRVFVKPSFYSLVIKCLQWFEKCSIEWLYFVGGMRRQWKHVHILITSYLNGIQVFCVRFVTVQNKQHFPICHWLHTFNELLHPLNKFISVHPPRIGTGHNTSRWGTVIKLLRSPFQKMFYHGWNILCPRGIHATDHRCCGASLSTWQWANLGFFPFFPSTFWHSLKGPPGGFDPTTHHIMSRRSISDIYRLKLI